MITPLQSPSSTSIAQGKGSAPYAGPERRVADRRRAGEASARTGGYLELGPYVPERVRVRQRTPGTPVSVFAASEGIESPVTDAVTFQVLDEEFIMAEAILADPAPHELSSHESSHASLTSESSYDGERASLDANDADLADDHVAIAPPRAAVELPWITAFLDDVPEATVSVESRAELDAAHAASAPSNILATVADAASTDASPIADEAAPDRAVDEAVADQAAIEAELWPLDDAGSRMRELASALESHTASDDAPAEQVAMSAHDARVTSTTPIVPLTMWSDDDFVDVMPVHVSSLPALNAVPPASPAHPVADDNGVAHETAALALEALARRVRRGEVDVPAFNAELGDAAALAMALAVLLGTRS